MKDLYVWCLLWSMVKVWCFLMYCHFSRQLRMNTYIFLQHAHQGHHPPSMFVNPLTIHHRVRRYVVIGRTRTRVGSRLPLHLVMGRGANGLQHPNFGASAGSSDLVRSAAEDRTWVHWIFSPTVMLQRLDTAPHLLWPLQDRQWWWYVNLAPN
jgi:hypothetical protein